MVTTTLSPSEDAFVHSGYVSRNYGTTTALQADASPSQKFFVKFPVTGLAGHEIVRAALKLYVVNPSPSGGRLHRVLDPWSETTLTWSNAPRYEEAVVSSLGNVSLGNWYEFDVSSLVRTDGSVSFAVDSLNSDGADYASREDVVYAPRLVITSTVSDTTPGPSPTPEPSPSPAPSPSPTTPPPAPITFTPTDDASVNSSYPNANYGLATALEADARPTKRSYLRFNVAGTTGNISRATLRLYNTDGSKAGGTLHVVSNTSWTQGALTWANAPTFAPGFAELPRVAPGNWYEIDVTRYVSADGFVGFALTSATSDGADYSSKEGARPPQLVVESR